MHVYDVILAKRISIEHCINQIESYLSLPRVIPFTEDVITQDAVTINI
jgi:hypothetical protein